MLCAVRTSQGGQRVNLAYRIHHAKGGHPCPRMGNPAALYRSGKGRVQRTSEGTLDQFEERRLVGLGPGASRHSSDVADAQVVNLDGLPLTMGAFEACMALPAFQQAQPKACPDFEA